MEVEREVEREVEMEVEREAEMEALELEEQEESDLQLVDDVPTVPLPNIVEWREWRWS